MNRKALLAALLVPLLLAGGALHLSRESHAQGAMTPDEPNHLPSTPPDVISSYGEDPLQLGDLRLPEGDGPFPVAVVIHGGCWTRGFATRQHTAAIASALTDEGYATWNIEYRQLGDDGAGWPGSFQDWGAATDHLRVLAEDYPLDLTQVLVTGHSAGAHAALFVASRPGLPETSEIRGDDPLPVQAAVAIDGPGDLARFIGADEQICGAPVIAPFFGGSPQEVPQRYQQGSPVNQLPEDAILGLVSASPVLDPESARAFQQAAVESGTETELVVLHDTGHFETIAPGGREWEEVEALIVEMFGRIAN